MRYVGIFILYFCCAQVYAQRDVPDTTGFTVIGAVRKEMKLGINDILHFKQDALGDVVIRNHRGEQKSIAKGLKGVLLRTILDSADIIAHKLKNTVNSLLHLLLPMAIRMCTHGMNCSIQI